MGLSGRCKFGVNSASQYCAAKKGLGGAASGFSLTNLVVIAIAANSGRLDRSLDGSG